jgi:sirohydrochlorin ferrochelatase
MLTPIMKEAILLIDHGSRLMEANAQLEIMAEMLRQKRSDNPDDPDEANNPIVGWAHMELCAPDIAAGFDYCVEKGAEAIVVFPYLLAAGRHVKESIPEHLAKAAAKYPHVAYRIVEPFGVHPLLAEIIGERCGL